LAITVVLAFYYTATSDFLAKQCGVRNIGSTMLIGQVCETVFLPLLPLFLLRFGMKWVLVLGMFCWGLRYFLFANAGPDGLPFALAIVGVALHGFCFDFFFAAGFIHCDNKAPRDIRASAQALFSFLTYGVGMWLGSLLCGRLLDQYTNPETKAVNWSEFWMVPSVGVMACLAVFLLLFRDRGAPVTDPEVKETAVTPPA
jgi:MFS family permease